jgi:phage FluMu gp28-like protein
LDNPYFPREEFEEARRTTPQDIFRQEYEAKFLEDSAGVFRNIEACLTPTTALPTGDIAIGCDIAKHTDWTVLIAMDRKTGACLDFVRFNHLDWPIQKERILAFCRKWRGLLVMDATGAGDPIFDDLSVVWPRIEAVKFTNQTKTELIQRLIVATEQKQISWPAAWDLLTNEMKRYEYAVTNNGAITYSAPSGFHDDCVIALALANKARHTFTNHTRLVVFSSAHAPSALRLSRRRLLLL